MIREDRKLWILSLVDGDCKDADDSLEQGFKHLAVAQHHETCVGHLDFEDALLAIGRARDEIAEAQRLVAAGIAKIEAALDAERELA